jgi:hypothetical protein
MTALVQHGNWWAGTGRDGVWRGYSVLADEGACGLTLVDAVGLAKSACARDPQYVADFLLVRDTIEKRAGIYFGSPYGRRGGRRTTA